VRRLRAWLVRLAGLFHKERRDLELEEEIATHLEMHVEDNLRRGMDAEEARRQALIKLGGVEQTKELYRERRGLPFLETLIQDLRYAPRTLRRSPGFTAVATATLALGIGANTAIFSIVNAVLLRPLPYPDSDRLVLIWATNTENGTKEDVASYPDFEEWKAQTASFTSLAAFTTRSMTVSGGDEAALVPAMQVSPGFFETLGIAPAIGRSFQPGEEQPAAAHVAVLSDALWKARFGGGADVLGRTVRMNEEGYTIVGVMAPGVKISPGAPEQLYVPIVRDPSRNHGFLRIVGRLRPRVSVSGAQAEMDLVTRRLAQQYPASNRAVGANVVPLVDAVAGKLRPGLLIFLGVVTLVLLIACANVANLTLARGAARQREIAVRTALGAARRRIVRQLLTESLVLAVGGGALGLLLSSWTARVLAAVVGRTFQVPRVEGTATDARVLAFTVVVSLATVIVFGLAPALASASPDVQDGLRESSRTATGGRRAGRVRGALVIAETALALVLLAGAGLLLRSLLVLRRTAPGFRTENLLAVDFWLPRTRFAAFPERQRFFDTVLARVSGVAGVRSAALVANLPMNGGWDQLGFHIPGRPDPPGKKAFIAQFNIVSAGYFKTMGVPLLAGREFGPQDSGTAPPVVVVNESAARRFWPGEDLVGRQITMPTGGTPANVTLTVIGQVGDVRQLGLGSEPQPEMFLSYLQPGPPWPRLTLVVRTWEDADTLAGTIRAAAAYADREVPIAQARTMDEVLASALAQPRVYAALLGCFAALALALASVGLYGVVSYTVAQRTHEMGIRVALGADRRHLVRLVLRQGLVLSLAGTATGLLGAIALTRVLTHVVPTVRPGDPLTLASVAALLVAVALAASLPPARRASRIDPLVALRHE
jgi:putative ABC transport system permease protein